MTKGAYTYENDVPMMVAKDYSIACCAQIAFRGSVKIELDEINLGGRQKRGAAKGGGEREEGGRA